jgi:alpha-ketoglutarate-dependent taurine dioxygenase
MDDPIPARLAGARRLLPDRPLPVVVEPPHAGDLAWLADHRSELDELLVGPGALLLRGFDVAALERFRELVRVFTDDLLDYTYQSTPRSRVGDGIFTSTEYPADQEIPLHGEMSFARRWPMRIWFGCLTAPAEQGETPIADARAVCRRIDPAVRERFARLGVMYVRNYHPYLDLPWQDVFNTSDRDEVEAFCRRTGIGVEWKEGDLLCTRQVCQGVAGHPRTGEPVWFNQAHLFHVSSLPDEARESLELSFDEADLPRNAYYGDGSPIGADELREVRRALAAEEVRFGWCEGDVLMLDNMLVAHGRRPFRGPRRIVVAMADPHESPA